MALFVTLLEGPSPIEAKAVFASDDPRIVQSVVRAMNRRLTEGEPVPRAQVAPQTASTNTRSARR
jgi:hypothetical protein